ncbi:HAMP domain-containing sensor histidine kinase [Clostridium sp.]|uniref:HAMP domain-containing sensor histidine kinase n=1 Tax=Clostridium sp. TaxID=1506 RepID=UPI0032165EE6
MNLSKKTFVYSAIISGTIVILMIAYFILMLPSLYVDYMNRGNFKSIKSIQETYIKEGNYNNISSRNPSATVTIKIPNKGNKVFIYNKLGSIDITINDSEILNFIEKLRYYSTHQEEIKNIDKGRFDFTKVTENIFKNKLLKENLPLTFEFSNSDSDNIYKEVSSKVNVISDDTIIYENNSTDGINQYTNYIAISINNGDIIASLLPVMTPQIEEIKPIIFQSLPMIIATAFLIILVSTILFSRKIVVPVEKLVNHAVFIKENTSRVVEPIEIEGQDEIAILGATLNELYVKLNENFNELEEKNQCLSEQNKRQEVFLRASSHQLKTPVAAALLLVDSMINEIGKYKDTKEYLPKVKIQLQSMRKIIDDILNLNNSIEDIEMEHIDVREIINESLLCNEVQIKLKELHMESEFKFINLNTDRNLLYKIIDNLISNAINYTSKDGNIKISLIEKSLIILNYGASIEKEILPHIFDPFVSSNSENRGHGLGLYIVAYYANLLGYEVKVRNVSEGVEAVMYFTENKTY